MKAMLVINVYKKCKKTGQSESRRMLCNNYISRNGMTNYTDERGRAGRHHSRSLGQSHGMTFEAQPIQC